MTAEKHNELNRKILIAVDGSLPALKSVDYAAKMVGLTPHLNITLMYVLPAVPPYLEEGVQDGPKIASIKKIRQANRVQADKVLKQAKEKLLLDSVPEDQIETVSLPRMTGLTSDIINYADTGLFDALLIGRRGLSKPQEMIMGSVSNQLIQHASNIPLWITDGQVENSRILIAVDGSDASLRAVDHLAFMLEGNQEAIFDFLHIVPKLQDFCAIDPSIVSEALGEDEADLEDHFDRENQACLDDFFPKAEKILVEAGFPPERIIMETKAITLGVARSIVKAANEGDYGTIVLGRKGSGKSPFLGGISDRVIRMVQGRAVWVIS